MQESEGWSTLAYKGLGGAPIWLVIAIMVVGLAWAAVAAARKKK